MQARAELALHRMGLSLAVGLAGCATTLDAEEVARAQRANQFSMDMAMQSAMQAQQANDLAMQAAILNSMMLNIALTIPPPMP